MTPDDVVKAAAARRVGVVVIGRNEGERLVRCLDSLVNRAASVVYVDSGSTDGSVTMSRGKGVDVVELDTTKPFTAARARNAGFDRLIERFPDTPYVMFVDGDCEVRDGWLAAAASVLDSQADRAVVFGRLRERFPEASIYNRLCDLEWDVPSGIVPACGGISVMRASAFRTMNGFDPAVIAGEEPELCVRLRGAGWTIEKLDAEMALHDASMTRFSQWWKRTVRAGHSYAEGAALHGITSRHFVRESLSVWAWGFVLPVVAIAGAYFTHGWSLLLLLAYPLLIAKITLRRRRERDEPWSWSLLYAAACVIAKPAMWLGQLRYLLRRATGAQPKIIEHK
ncbi:MAG: glycosyltransferase family 2 protein [Planctomycetaceae bacterium]